ncbi:MAG: HAD-IA family hydrolase [Anaeroplasma bactoclasticum]|nr:HAD-IA family hydrolase [Anaeroplasma bactoclasticum]
MNIKSKVIIFDCDGTLLDTFLLIEKSVLMTFEKYLPTYPITRQEAHQFFGPFLNDSFQKYVKTEEEVNQLVSYYRYINQKLMPQYIKAYDGILDLLKSLQAYGYKMAIVSNKVTDDVVKGLMLCHIDTYFDLVIGAEKLKEAKPHPDGIFQVLQYFQASDAVMIGDTIIDIETGKQANIPTIGVTWCKTSKEEFISHQASAVVDLPEQILQVLGAKA